MFQRIKDVGHPDEPMLSVYRDHGVVMKDSRDDNYNKTAENRDIYQLVEPGWLVINRMKAWQGAVGISPFRGIVSGHYICFRPRHSEDGRFLNYLLRSQVYAHKFRELSRGVRPSQFEIDNDMLRVLPIPLPELLVQRAIADLLDAQTARIDALLGARQRMLALLAERRVAVMHEGISGRFTSSDPAAERPLPWLERMPSHWRVAKLSLIGQLGSGHTPSREHGEWWVADECVIPWITTGEVAQMRSDRIEQLTETRECVSEVGIANSAAAVHPAGTVVLCRTASAGYSAIMGSDMATSQDFAAWTCGSLIRPRFLLLCLRVMRQDLLGRLATGSTHKTIYMPDIESIRVPLPPVDEQDRIVDEVWRRLHRIDHAIDAIEWQNSMLQEHRQALITAAVTGELDVTKAA